MLSLIPHVPAFLEFIILLAAAVGGFIALKKSVYNPIKKFSNRVNSGMDTLLGYPAVHDPGSGKELKPPTPPLALRVDTLEEAMNRLLALQEKQVGFNERLLNLEQWRKEHQEFSEAKWQSVHDENVTWQKEHEAVHLLSHETAQQIKRTD